MSNATVEVIRLNLPPEIVQMSEGKWIIGREQGNLVMNDPQVSARHGQIEVSPGSLKYTDLGSTNGSYLGSSSERITSSVELKEGDSIRLGESVIKIRSVPPPAMSASGTVFVAQSGGVPSASSVGSGQAAPSGSPLPAPAIPSLSQQPSAVVPPLSERSIPAIPSSSERPSAAAPRSPVSAESDSSFGFSLPDQPVRHSYPLSIRDASVATAIGLVAKTLPYALVRFGILLAFTVATIIWYIITFGGAAFLANKVTLMGYIWAAGGLAIYGWAWWFVIRYFLYLVKAGHIAVLTELITKDSIANGEKGMFQYGTEVVKSRFGQVNAMFALDLLIHGVVRAFNRTLDFIAGLLPIPGLSSVMSIVNSIIYAATTYIDETIFSYNLARGDDNPWRSSKDGLIYYAQNAKEVLKTGVWIVVLDKVLSVVVWVVMLAPAFIITYLLPSSLAGWGGTFAFVTAILFAANIRGAFLKPLFLTMVMIKFHVCVENQTINETWDNRLTSVSKKFQEIKDKALGFGEPAGQPASS
ncbi:MAG: FHA domain-containing protein [Deltaproteobacteria bacterium]|nr:FHA domain-containing protein [Deltaproteobacteria bacterium]